jgi:hypothetical protein
MMHLLQQAWQGAQQVALCMPYNSKLLFLYDFRAKQLARAVEIGSYVSAWFCYLVVPFCN